MALIGCISKNVRCCLNVNIIVNGFHTSALRKMNLKWRQDNRLPDNPNSFGPLVNLPDYSYADGRPVPFGVRQLGRINKQRQYLQRIRKLAGEVDYAVARHARIQNQNAIERKQIIEGKLKPKGQLQLNESSQA